MTRLYPPSVLNTASTQLPAWRQLFVVLLTLATLAACKHRNQTTDAPGAGQSSSPPSFGGQLVQGADQRAIRTYLKSVRELTPKKFAVTWRTDTVVARKRAARLPHPELPGIRQFLTKCICTHILPHHAIHLYSDVLQLLRHPAGRPARD